MEFNLPELTETQREYLWRATIPVCFAIAFLGVLFNAYKDGFGVEVTIETINDRPAYCAEGATLKELGHKLIISDTFFGETPNLNYPIVDDQGTVCYLYQDVE